MSVATDQRASAAQEWRAHWYLPLVAGIGFTATSLYAYGIGPFIEPLQQAFGWTRAEVMIGLTVVNLPQILLLPLVGQLIDHWGPRRMALIGTFMVPAAFALLGTATGSSLNWLMLWAVIALMAPFAQGGVWTAPVVGRFAAGRGLALAVTLSAPSLASAVMPLLATMATGQLGWRHGFMVFAGIWGLLMFLPVLLFFPRSRAPAHPAGKASPAPASDTVPGLTLAEALRRFAFYKLMLTALAYSLVLIAMVVHLVPLLKGFGATPLQAAGTAGLYGIFSIVGRLATGTLLDRFRSNIVGFIGYMLPVPGLLLLLLAGSVPLNQAIAVSLFGLAAGAQLNIFTYLLAQHFGLKRYASLSSVIFSLVAAGAAIGPFLAGVSFDRFGNYTVYMIAASGVAVAASLAVLSMVRPAYGQTR